MNDTTLHPAIDCGGFRRRIFEFVVEELPPAERASCQSHLDGCPSCAERLEQERHLLRVLRAKLPRTPAPPGLETRIRAALRREAPAPAAARWLRSPWLAATAAALLLVAVLVPGLTGRRFVGSEGSPIHVTERVMVVDYDCDKVGMPIDRQRGCSHPLHVNALRLADGRYWTLSADQHDYRYLMLEAAQRGRRFEVEGDLYPGLRTIRLQRVESLGGGNL